MDIVYMYLYFFLHIFFLNVNWGGVDHGHDPTVFVVWRCWSSLSYDVLDLEVPLSFAKAPGKSTSEPAAIRGSYTLDTQTPKLPLVPSALVELGLFGFSEPLWCRFVWFCDLELFSPFCVDKVEPEDQALAPWLSFDPLDSERLGRGAPVERGSWSRMYRTSSSTLRWRNIWASDQKHGHEPGDKGSRHFKTYVLCFGFNIEINWIMCKHDVFGFPASCMTFCWLFNSGFCWSSSMQDWDEPWS